MADSHETRTHEEREALTGSGYRGGLESLDAPPPRGVQQIQAATGSSNQATGGADPNDFDD
ncbi:hypothetical protein [Nocardia testacea]|uniref:hypothetical protein n=1 Tax=Nocardia testacea TaxID=248551 RepID=UPI003A879140